LIEINQNRFGLILVKKSTTESLEKLYLQQPHQVKELNSKKKNRTKISCFSFR